MAERTLYDKIWQSHTVGVLPTGQTQLFIGLHLIHEITTAPAFDMLREKGMDVAFRDRTFATVDHIVPTDMRQRPFLDKEAEDLTQALERNVEQFGVEFFGLDSMNQGIVHVIGPQLGLTQPGMTLACGDSHTSTHGAFGTLAFGIGTSQVRDVLATQTLAMDKLKVRRINVNGALGTGVYAKDVILHIIRHLGVSGGKGYAYEYGGEVIDRMNMEERMTVCNMSIEGGALVGYVNPGSDHVRLHQRPSPCAQGRGVRHGGQVLAVRCVRRRRPVRRCRELRRQRHRADGDLGHQSRPVGRCVGKPASAGKVERSREREESLRAYGLDAWRADHRHPGQRGFHRFLHQRPPRRFSRCGENRQGQQGKSQRACLGGARLGGGEKLAEAEGLDKIFEEAGFQWREAGCSMCLAMNPDKLNGREISASSSNRNFIGRQGSPQGRTLLMSPAMVTAAALNGKVVDVREYE